MFDYDEDDDTLNEAEESEEEGNAYGQQYSMRRRENIRELVESVVDVIRWHDDFAEVVCPCGHRDAHLYVTRSIPRLHCLHERCRTDVAEVNVQLRELAGATLTPEQWAAMFKPDKAEQARRNRLALIRAQAHNRLLPDLLRKRRPIEHDEWLDRSPFGLDGRDLRHDWTLFIRALYKQRNPSKPEDWLNRSDLLWVGELWESGKPEYKRCFRRVDEWLRLRYCPGSQICVAPFQDSWSYRRQTLKDTWRRSKHWTLARSYYVAESDTLKAEQFGIVIEYLQRFSTLRAIVDTGGKSLHAWFDVPGPPRLSVERPQLPIRTAEQHAESEWASANWRHDGKAADTMTRLAQESDERYAAFKPRLEAWERENAAQLKKHERQLALHDKRLPELYAVAEGLGCDRMMFRACPTARLPGCERLDADGQPTGRWQTLLYLNPKYPIAE
jgi:hypothetical protein